MSELAPHFDGYLTLMRAVGRRYERVEQILVQLDRFLEIEGATDVVLTREILGRWLASTPHLAPSTLRAHASASRQFCRYMARSEPRTWIPDRSLYPARIPQFRPHLFTTEEVRALVAAADRLPAKIWPLRRRTFRALLLLLFATGLRVGEALKLRIGDVDIEANTLFIAETKFFKSRWVPFTVSLAEGLREYDAERAQAVSRVGPDEPFFISARREACGYSAVASVFQLLVRDAGIDTSATRRGSARLHDLRHAFAVHCVLRWYREGADVQTKLPLLATYMGHASVLATHVYLHATSELLAEANQRFERCFSPLVVAPGGEINHVGE
ncbi:MAG: tyrosine-type recombinase/integrase [Candidatus Dormibacteria bacterium]